MDTRRARSERIRWSDASGRSGLSGLLALLIVVGGVYGGLKFIPVRAAAFQLDDAVREQVVLAGSGRRRITENNIREALLNRIDDLGLPIERHQIQIRKRNDSIRVEIQYVVPVHLLFGYVYEWSFETRHEGPTF